MPYPNEHACRLHPPGRYGEWGRTTRRSATVGKQYSVIRGRKKSDGKWEDQAYRYNRNRWSADKARRHCRSHDGRFEAAAPKTQERRRHVRKIGFNVVTLGESYSTREEQFEGRSHLVVPVVILMEGVHVGTAGARFYPGEEVGKYIDSWNGVPLPVFHPEDYGGYVTANTPQLLESRSVGRFFHASFDPEGSKLKGELWVDIAKAEEINPQVLVILRAGQPLEISTALWWDEDGVAGTWQGEQYDSTVRNFRPDHVALLPGGEGACSVSDGCGVRANKAKGLVDRFKGFVSSLAAKMGLGVETLEMSHEDLRSRVQTAVDTLDTSSWVHVVKAIFDDNVVYEAIALNPSAGAIGGASQLFRCGYTVDSDEKVTLKENVEEVRKEVNYVPVANEKGTVNRNQKPQSEERTMEKKKELVEALIACDKTKFEETDRKQLMTLPEEMLEKLKAPEVDPKQKEDRKGLVDAFLNSAKTPFDEEDREHLMTLPEKVLEKLKAPEGSKEPEKKPAITGEPGKEVTLDDYIKGAPKEVQGVLLRSVNRDRAVKADLVKALIENDRNEFTEKQLKEKDIDELKLLVTLGRIPFDFTGQVGAAAAEDSDEIPEALPVFEPATK